MERYTLLICQSSTEEKALNQLRASFLPECELSRQAFQAILSLNQSENPSETFLEKDYCCWKNTKKLAGKLNIITFDSWLTLAAAINGLADCLPEVGQYFVDVYCYCNVLFEEMPKDKPELWLSLERLEIWHNAHIVLHQPKRLTSEEMACLEKWAEWLHASISNNLWPFSGLKLWYGSIGFPESRPLQGFELLLPGDAESNISDVKTHSVLKKLILENNVTHVSTSLDYQAELNLQSIPPYLFSTFKFFLLIPEGKRTYSTPYSFMEFLQNRPNMGVVFSLDFTNSGTTENRKYDFDAWTKSFENGTYPVEHPQACLPDNSPHLTFVVYWGANSRHPRHSLVAHLLMDPDDLDLSGALPQLLDTSQTVSCGQKAHETFGDWDCEWVGLIPKLDQSFSLRSKDECDEDDEDKKEDLCQQDVDPIDWPERRFLLLRDLKKSKNQDSSGLPSDSSVKKVIELKASDFAKYFDSNGLPKQSSLRRKKEMLQIQVLEGGKGSYPIRVQNSLEDVLQSEWPDLKWVQYHDLYLNHSTMTENLETACVLLKNQFVLQETSCSDPNSNGSTKVGCSTPVHWNPDSPSKKSIAYENDMIPDNSAKLCRKNPKKTKKPAEDICRKVKASSLKQPKHFLSQTKTLHPSKWCSSQLKDKNNSLWESNASVQCARPLRSSPRSKKGLVLKSAENVSNKSTSELSENHKKKLREAVATALESEGISLTSPAFKTCGRRLFNVCKAFVQDILGKGNTSALMKKIASAHVKQVIEFEKINS